MFSDWDIVTQENKVNSFYQIWHNTVYTAGHVKNMAGSVSPLLERGRLSKFRNWFEKQRI